MPEEEWIQSDESCSSKAYLDHDLPIEDLNLTGAHSLKKMEEEYNNMTKGKTSFTHD